MRIVENSWREGTEAFEAPDDLAPYTKTACCGVLAARRAISSGGKQSGSSRMDRQVISIPDFGHGRPAGPYTSRPNASRRTGRGDGTGTPSTVFALRVAAHRSQVAIQPREHLADCLTSGEVKAVSSFKHDVPLVLKSCPEAFEQRHLRRFHR